MVCPSVDFQAVTSPAKYCSHIILDDFWGVFDAVWFLTGFFFPLGLWLKFGVLIIWDKSVF